MITGSPSASKTAVSDPAPRPADTMPSEARSVLLVEDNDEVAAATGAVLRSFGWAVERAGDAETALELIDAGLVPDVVLADIVMPGAFDGAQLAVHLRRTHPLLRVVLMTGYIAEVHRASEEGGFLLLPKPCSISELVAALAGGA
jgi:two-component system NtrC family sensor kinase